MSRTGILGGRSAGIRPGRLGMGRLAGGAALAAVALVAVLGAPAVPGAVAADLGNLTVSPPQGAPADAWTYSVPAACSAPADAYELVVSGPGVAEDPATAVAGAPAGVVVEGPVPGSPEPGTPIDAARPLLDTLSAAAGGAAPAYVEYAVSLLCLVSAADGSHTATGDWFAVAVDLASDTAYTTAPYTPATSSTAVVVVDATPQPVLVGESLTMRATVVDPGGTPTGTVTFSLDGTAVATTPLDATGVATTTITATSAGTQTLSAVFIGSDGTTSDAATASVVTQAPSPPQASVTTLSIVEDGSGNVTLTARVTAEEAAADAPPPTGSCTFRQAQAVLAEGVALDDTGTCELLRGPLPGNDDVTAEYVPGGGSPLLASTSAPVAVTSSPPTPEVTTLALSTPFTAERPPDFGVAQLSANATLWWAELPIGSPDGTGGIEVVDTRPGNVPFSVSVAADTSGSPRPLPPDAISITAMQPHYEPGDRLDGLTPDTSITTFGVGSLDGGPKVLATGTGPGRAGLTGRMRVQLPTSTAPGQFTVRISFTVS